MRVNDVLGGWSFFLLPFSQRICAACGVSGHCQEGRTTRLQYYDLESGWNHNGFRDYLPDLGRYAEPDPLGRAGSGNNLYAYVGDNPIDFIDPLGLKCGCGSQSAQQQQGVPTASQIPDHVDIVGPSEIPPGELGHGGAKYWWYLLKSSQGTTLSGNGYGAEEHVEELMDRGLQIDDQTSEGNFTPVVQGYIRDTVGLALAPGSGTYMDYRVKQWFTICYKGVQYDLSTELEHRVIVVNGVVHTYVWDLVP